MTHKGHPDRDQYVTIFNLSLSALGDFFCRAVLIFATLNFPFRLS